MLDRISKIATIFAASVAITVILIGGVAWAVRLDTDLRSVQRDVGELRIEFAELREDMAEVKENQQLILQTLERLETAFASHTHDQDGRVVIPLTQR